MPILRRKGDPDSRCNTIMNGGSPLPEDAIKAEQVGVEIRLSGRVTKRQLKKANHWPKRVLPPPTKNRNYFNVLYPYLHITWCTYVCIFRKF